VDEVETMSLVVEYRESGEHLHITEAAEAVPEMTLTIERWRKEPADRLSLFVLADGEQFDAFEAALRDLSNILDVACLSDQDAATLYQIRVRSKQSHPPPQYSTVNGVVSHVRIEPDGLYVTVYLADREELIKTREFILEQGLEMEVLRLQEATRRPTPERLTDVQLEAVITAYEMGYFDVPAQTTQAEVADVLGVTPPSLSERLTRAKEVLVEQHLVADRGIDDLA